MAQTSEKPCGADSLNRYRLKTDSTYRQEIEKVIRRAADKTGIDMNTVHTIPVVFVVYHLGEPVGTGSNLSDATLQAALAQMNDRFRSRNPRYPAYAGPDTKLQFTLAQRTPDCQSFNGIVRVNASSVPNYSTTGVDSRSFQVENALKALTPQYSQGGADNGFITIHIVRRINPAAAYAYYGGNIFCDMNYLGVLTHEMGHVFYLPHTFEGSQGSTCPPNNNPAVDGDGIADTDPHLMDDDCQSTGNDTHINGCTGRPFGTILYNWMSYSCGSRFTDGQTVRMRTALQVSMYNLINSPFLNPILPNEVVRPVSCVNTTGIAASGGYGVGLSRVQFNTLDVTSGYVPYYDGYYKDNSCFHKTIVTAGLAYSINTTSNARHHRVYIDYNNDGSFDETTEKVASNSTSDNYTLPTRSSTFIIPTTAIRNTYLRLRIVVDPGSTPPTACNLPGIATLGYGELEDYGVLILPDGPPALAITTLPRLPFCPGKVSALPCSVSGTFGTGNQFTALLSDANGNFSAATVIGSGTVLPLTVSMPNNLNLSGNYRVRITASNPAISSNDSPVLIVEERPTATLTGSQTINQGAGAPLTIQLTGGVPWTITLANQSGTVSTYGGIEATSFQPLVYPTATTTYTLSRVENHCGTGAVAGTAVVTVRCPQPVSLTETNKTTNSIRLNWSNQSGITYTVQWRQQGAGNWITLPGSLSSPVTLSGLTLGQSYQWRVQAVCTNGGLPSDWTAERTFVMDCPIPGEIAELVNTSSAQLVWNSMGNDVTYTVQWRQQGVNTWTTPPNLTTNTLLLNNLNTGMGYEWQVRTNCSGGVQSAFSAIRSFTATCANPLSMSAGPVSSTVRVAWSDAWATSYDVRWRPVGAASWTNSASTTSLYYDISDIQTGVSYEWQVRSVCGGVTVAYSQTGYFSAGCDPFEPNNTAGTATPITGTSFSSPNLCLNPTGDVDWFSWVYSGKTYYIRVNHFSTTGTGNYRLNMSVANSILTLTTQQVGTATTDTYLYLYDSNGTTELASNDDFNSTVFSQLSYTLPTCNNPSSLTAGPVTSTVRVSWASALAVAYQVRWRTAGSTTWTESTTLTNLFYDISPIQAGQSYEWQVRSICAGGVALAFSVTGYFSTSCDPLEPNDTYQTATQLADGANYVSPALCLGSGTDQDWFRWRTAGGGLTYYINVRPFGTSSGPYTLSVTLSGDVLTIQTGFVTTGQSTDTYLYLYGADGTTLLDSNDDFNGLFSRVVYVLSTPPVCPKSLNQYIGPITPTAARLDWSFTSSRQYNIRYRALGSGTWTTVSGLTTTSYSLTGLTNSTSYEWQVQTVCSASASSDFTASTTFVTACTAPGSQYAYAQTSTSAYFYWEWMGDGVQYEFNYRAVSTPNWTSVPNLTESSYTLLGLTNGITYEFRVRTLCGTSGTSAFTTPTTFRANCNAPTDPFGDSYFNSGTQASLYWSGVSDEQTRYEVRYRAVGTTTFILKPGPIATTYTNLTGLIPNTAYEFEVRTLCSDGLSSTFTPSSSFTTGNCRAPVLLEVDDLTGQSARLNWTSSEPGMIYYPRYRVVGTTTWVNTSPASTSNTSFVLNGLPGNTTYEWQVLTQCSGSINSSATVGAPFTTLTPCTNGVVSVKNGNWNDPTVWSCNQVPTSSDPLTINHSVNLPSGLAGNALRIRYGVGGKLIFGTGSKIRLGP